MILTKSYAAASFASLLSLSGVPFRNKLTNTNGTASDGSWATAAAKLLVTDPLLLAPVDRGLTAGASDTADAVDPGAGAATPAAAVGLVLVSSVGGSSWGTGQ